MNNSIESADIGLRVWGDYACFTRPEMKVERVSYDVMTPSAARGILEAILWKPAICWQIKAIEVMKDIQWTTVRRNEVGSVVSTSNVNTAMNKGSGNLALYIEEDRQQRAGLILREVEYIIRANFKMTSCAGQSDSITKFYEMFLRRAKKGQCFNQPYLGCREFSAFFELVDEGTEYKPIKETKDLGWMLYDMCFDKEEPEPSFFRGWLKGGVLSVPKALSEEVRR